MDDGGTLAREIYNAYRAWGMDVYGRRMRSWSRLTAREQYPWRRFAEMVVNRRRG